MKRSTAPKPPSVLLIAARRLSLVFDQSVISTPNQGEYDSVKSQIVICSSLKPDEAKATVVHEILHDLSNIVHAELDETQVTGLATVLFGVIRDNPQLIAWLANRNE